MGVKMVEEFIPNEEQKKALIEYAKEYKIIERVREKFNEQFGTSYTHPTISKNLKKLASEINKPKNTKDENNNHVENKAPSDKSGNGQTPPGGDGGGVDDTGKKEGDKNSPGDQKENDKLDRSSKANPEECYQTINKNLGIINSKINSLESSVIKLKNEVQSIKPINIVNHKDTVNQMDLSNPPKFKIKQITSNIDKLDEKQRLYLCSVSVI